MTKTQKNPVSKCALLRRVNRRLAKDLQQLKVWRSFGHHGGESWQPGDFCHVDHELNAMLECRVDLEAFARELGVLRESECLLD